MRKLIGLMCVSLFATAAVCEETFRHGQFAVELDPASSYLPVSLQWTKHRNTELLPSKDRKGLGLNLTFTDFEFRRKVYREENQRRWRRENWKFTFEAKDATKSQVPVAAGGYRGLEVTYGADHAKVTRRLLLHDAEPVARIEYHMEITRQLVIHDAEMFGVDLLLADAFADGAMGDARAENPALLRGKGLGGVPYRARLVNAGPAIRTAPGQNATVLLTNRIEGDLPDPVPPRLIRLQPGQKVRIAIQIRCFAGDDPKLTAETLAAVGALPAHQRPYLLVENARALKQQGKVAEAEKALLLAAKLNKEYATPYVVLASYRDVGIDPAIAFTYAAYRMPYNYGFILSGRGFCNTKGLTLAEKRNAIFNMLVTAENYAMIPNYYSWVARPFEEMGMTVQALAIYRQALWAEKHLARERGEDVEKSGAKHQKKIAELEQKILSAAPVDLPGLVPVAAPGDAPAE